MIEKLQSQCLDRGGLGLAEMIETHLDKINVSSKDILENRFKLNKSISS